MIPDMFNDITRLNDAMLTVVHKYDLFGETEKAFEEVKKSLDAARRKIE